MARILLPNSLPLSRGPLCLSSIQTGEDSHGTSPAKSFEAWKLGETGFPIIDAGIRELLKTGFMHNRVRMIVAMFLTKDLHIDWRLGEQFFAQHLLDGEIASNNGGWQWSAGTGSRCGSLLPNSESVVSDKTV